MELGSAEYAVEYLHTTMIIVMGHENYKASKAVEKSTKAEVNLAVLLASTQKEPDLQRV